MKWGQGTIFERLGELPQVAKLVDWTLIALDKDSGVIRLSFTALEEFTNPAGTVHGGFLTAMLDECMGSAIVGLSDARFRPATISMTTDFIKPVAVGKLLSEGRITSMNKSIAFVEASLTDPAGAVLTRATGVYRLLPWPAAAAPESRST